MVVSTMGLDIRSKDDLLNANEEYLSNQVKRYIQLARILIRKEELGPVIGLAENMLAIAAMFQQENIFGDAEDGDLPF